ncbi:DUF421 domain-containing protein [Planctomyces sp. SH-PL62]|uniref:DUF421 domain-containing protein n=1 Tax=Planctomyces sp. SH-PL62 TaxID=1636152 RepID=UPI00078C98C2|nr:YetF domain-containing protein [Planctomyces sp. SH-PL62]AMV37338.1 hypothetical protein VT85_07885 [Planctomyces sp. SH-PL62]
MNSILRAVAVYVFLLFVVRAAGRRTLGEMRTFDFVLLLIMSEATQNAMIGDDFSLTSAALVILTLLGLDLSLAAAKRRWKPLDRVVDGLPTILIESGRPLEDRLAWARVDLEDVLEAARRSQGLESLAQVKYAILERNGDISIIPADR